LEERSRVSRAGRKARAEGMGPMMAFSERSSFRRAAQAEKAASGRVPPRLLLAMERLAREGRRQSAASGRGPESWRLSKLREATAPVAASHVTAVQLHGVASRWFQSERAFVGSESWSLAWRRKRPSWFRERVGFRERKRSRNKNS